MNKLLLFVAAFVALIVIALSADCECDIGIYLKDVNNKCSGKVKDIKIADIPEQCIQVYDSPALYIDISQCSNTNVTIGLYPNAKCTIAVKKEAVPCGQCREIQDPTNNITFAVSPTCKTN
eukprot:525997_1